MSHYEFEYDVKCKYVIIFPKKKFQKGLSSPWMNPIPFCSRDAILVGIGNALTSIYSGFVIFSVLGYMAYIKGVSVEGVTSKGPGLAFVAYPEGLAMIPGAPFWSVCFFFMMFTVGLDSLVSKMNSRAEFVLGNMKNMLVFSIISQHWNGM